MNSWATSLINYPVSKIATNASSTTSTSRKAEMARLSKTCSLRVSLERQKTMLSRLSRQTIFLETLRTSARTRVYVRLTSTLPSLRCSSRTNSIVLRLQAFQEDSWAQTTAIPTTKRARTSSNKPMREYSSTLKQSNAEKIFVQKIGCVLNYSRFSPSARTRRRASATASCSASSRWSF